MKFLRGLTFGTVWLAVSAGGAWALLDSRLVSSVAAHWPLLLRALLALAWISIGWDEASRLRRIWHVRDVIKSDPCLAREVMSRRGKRSESLIMVFVFGGLGALLLNGFGVYGLTRYVFMTQVAARSLMTSLAVACFVGFGALALWMARAERHLAVQLQLSSTSTGLASYFALIRTYFGKR